MRADSDRLMSLRGSTLLKRDLRSARESLVAESELAPWLLAYRDPSRWRNRPAFRKAAALPRPPISVRAIAVLVLEIPCHSCPWLKIGQKRPGFSLVKRAAWVT
jgi:hypothetical protein